MLKTKQVVIIDDDDDDCSFFQLGIQRWDQEVALNRYISGEAFINSQLWKRKEHPLNLILLELMLPGEDGLSWLKVFLQHECCQGIPVVIYSCFEIDFETCKQAGATDYITKPSGLAQLNTVVSQIRANWLMN